MYWNPNLHNSYFRAIRHYYKIITLQLIKWRRKCWPIFIKDFYCLCSVVVRFVTRWEEIKSSVRCRWFTGCTVRPCNKKHLEFVCGVHGKLLSNIPVGRVCHNARCSLVLLLLLIFLVATRSADEIQSFNAVQMIDSIHTSRWCRSNGNCSRFDRSLHVSRVLSAKGSK